MTRNAADIAGVGATHGTIAIGKSADLVVWSGAPTDLTSRVEHVSPRAATSSTPHRPKEPPDDAHQLPPRRGPRRSARAGRSVGRLDGPREEGLHLHGGGPRERSRRRQGRQDRRFDPRRRGAAGRAGRRGGHRRNGRRQCPRERGPSLGRGVPRGDADDRGEVRHRSLRPGAPREQRGHDDLNAPLNQNCVGGIGRS